MNRGTIVTAAQEIYNEETGDYISTDYLEARYNEAKSRLERRTLCVPVSETFNLVESQRTYIIPAGMHAIRKGGALVSGAGPIRPATLAEIIGLNRLNWDTLESTYPKYFYLAEELKTVSGTTNWAIGTYPIVSADITNGMTLLGYGISADASADATAPPWPTPYHFTLVWELCVMAATRDMDYTGRNARPLQHFRDELAKAEAELRAASDEHSMTGATLQIGAGAPGQAEDDPVMHVSITL